MLEQPDNRLGILRSVEALVFDLSTALVLAPKTLVRVLFSPGWPYRYVRRQLQTREADRFEDYVPPVFFWLLFGVLPAYWFLDEIATLFDSLNLIFGGDRSSPDAWVDWWLSAGLRERLVAVVSTMIWIPLSCSALQAYLLHHRVSRDTVRGFFYSQAYVFGGFFFLLWLVSLLYESASQLVLIIATLGSFIWLAASHLILYRRGFRYPWLRSGLVFGISIAASIGLVVAVSAFLLNLPTISTTN